MPAHSAIRPEESLRRFLKYSIFLHCALLAAAIVSTVVSHSGENWGAPGGSVTVGLVGSVPAIPLPRPEVETPNRVVDNSKGLFKAEPKPAPKPEQDATPIPKFEKNKPPKYISRPSKVLENPTPPPPNAIPYGRGGAPTVPVSSFTIGQTGTTQAGMSIGATGAGDFGSRYPWYVEAVRNRISSNWLQSAIDPSLSYAPRVTVTFTILRNGSVANVQLSQRSNNFSVDNSAIRAVQNSNPFQPPPSGSEVNVEFWFDYRR